jgi:N4-gp56 family major capsid protein
MAVFDNLNYTHSSGVAPGLVQFYEKTLLENAKPEMVHSRDAQKRTLPMHNGKRVQFRRFTPFDAVTKPLSEGVSPAGQTLTQTAFTVMVKPYGAHVETTEEMQYYLLDNIHRETAQLLSDQAALSLDTVSCDALNAGLNVQFNGSNTSRGTIAATDKLTYADIKKAVRTLKRNNCKPFDDGYYHAIVHPDTVHDLTSDTMWVDRAKYQSGEKVDKYELGVIYKVKFFESSNAKVFETQSNLFGTTAKWTLAALDAAGKCITVSDTITEDAAREMTGRLVDVAYTKTGVTAKTPMCIERIDAAAKKVYFRWMPASAVTAEWTTGQAAEILPTGGGNNAAVYSTVVYGKDAFGDIALEGGGKNIQIIINPPGSAGAADPEAQRGTIAWKVKGFATAILQDDFIVRIEHGATA